MAINDIFQVVAEWQHAGNAQRANWVFHVQCTSIGSASGDAANLAEVVEQDIEILSIPSVHPAWIAQNVTVQNLTVPADFAQQPLAYVPNLTGVAPPSFLAVGIRSQKQARNHNRGRANLPLLNGDFIGSGGQVNEAGRELAEPWASYAGSIRVAASTGEQWTPVTVRYIYSQGVLQDVIVRSVVTGLWEIDAEWTTVKSRQAYLWTPID